MSKIVVSGIYGAALLALMGTASAGPMSVASLQTVTPSSQIEQVRYYRYHPWRHHRSSGTTAGAMGGIAGATITGGMLGTVIDIGIRSAQRQGPRSA
jgi:hypothetical protein